MHSTFKTNGLLSIGFLRFRLNSVHTARRIVLVTCKQCLASSPLLLVPAQPSSTQLCMILWLQVSDVTESARAKHTKKYQRERWRGECQAFLPSGFHQLQWNQENSLLQHHQGPRSKRSRFWPATPLWQILVEYLWQLLICIRLVCFHSFTKGPLT